MVGNRAALQFIRNPKTQVKAVLLELKSLFRGSSERVPLAYQDVRALRAFLEKSDQLGIKSLLALLADEAPWRADVPHEVAQILEEQNDRTRLQMILAEDDLLDVSFELTEARIPLLLMGESELALRWTQGTLKRPTKSIDFLVPREHHRQAIRLLGQMGFKYQSNSVRPSSIHKRECLEISRKQGAPLIRLWKDLESDQALWESTRNLRSPQLPRLLRVPSTEDSLVGCLRDSIKAGGSGAQLLVLATPMIFVDLFMLGQSSNNLESTNWDLVLWKLQEEQMVLYAWLLLHILNAEFTANESFHFYQPLYKKLTSEIAPWRRRLIQSQFKLDKWFSGFQMGVLPKSWTPRILLSHKWNLSTVFANGYLAKRSFPKLSPMRAKE